MMRIAAIAFGALALIACNRGPSQADLDSTRGGRLDVFFNEPGTRPDNLWIPDAERALIELINAAQAKIDIAVMGFTHTGIINALLAADLRGVQIRFVGDAGHLTNRGYVAFQQARIPMSVGNQAHIMHNKFVVVDDRFVFAGTANFSHSDVRQNNNNFLNIDSPAIAADFTAEFEQMFQGAFGHNKVELDNGRVYQVGDTEVEVWFTPNEDALGRILEKLDLAEDSIRFTIFAFTKDSVGATFIRKHNEFLEKNEDDEGNQNPDGPFAERTVAGVVDQSQLHSNGQYHEAYRLLAAGVPVRLDGNDQAVQPGDYQAGGGRLHSKTMIIDAYGENPTVITGSFNWSAAATNSNDEFLLVLRGERVTRMYDEYFNRLWSQGRHIGNSTVADGDVEPGDVLINEVMWYGVTPKDPDGVDEFIELRNTTDENIDLSMWQISGPDDVVLGFPPGSVIPADGLFFVADHALEPYNEGRPQDGVTAYRNADLVLNAFNDNRQARLYLKDGSMALTLRDPGGVDMDYAGDGGGAFAGGPGNDGKVRSMERKSSADDGRERSSWGAAEGDEGGSNVNSEFRDLIVATPGEENTQ